MKYTRTELIQARLALFPMRYSKESDEPHSFSSTQFNLSDGGYMRSQGSCLPMLKELLSSIPDDELAEDGKESADSLHITVKYGIHADSPRNIREAVESFGPVEIELGKTSIFSADEYDVLKVDVSGKDIHRLNKLISESTKVTDTHPTYKPHLTLAYLKKGNAKKYVGDSSVDGMKLTFGTLHFTSKDRDSIPIEMVKS